MSRPYLRYSTTSHHKTSVSRYTALTNQRHLRLSRHFRTGVRDASWPLYNAPAH
jgi:hypothetical protein